MTHSHEKSPMHAAPPASAIGEEERVGLTSQRAEELVKEFGYNELPVIEISLWYLLFLQFTGTMPYMLELACVIALACEDFADFAIILAMLCANGFLGFYEQLKAAESLVSENLRHFPNFLFLTPRIFLERTYE